MTVLIRLKSDNFDNELLTVEAYEEVALQMSSSDYGMHRATPVIVGESFDDWENVIILEKIIERKIK